MKIITYWGKSEELWSYGYRQERLYGRLET